MKIQNPNKYDFPSLGFGLVAFFVLYPVFFWYHAGIAYNVIPAETKVLLAGLYGRASALVVVSAGIYLFYRLLHGGNFQNFNARWIIWLFIAYLIWAFIWSGINLYFFPKPHTEEAAVKLLKDCVLQSANLIVGIYLVIRPTKVAIWTVGLIWFSMVGFVIANTNPAMGSLSHTLLLDPSIRELRDEHYGLATYQGFARSIMMLSLLFIALIHVGFLRLIVGTLSVVTMYLIGARAEFFGFGFGLFCLELGIAYFYRRHLKNLFIFGFLGFLTLLLLSLGFYELFSSSRINSITDLGSDGSWNTRMRQMQFSIDAISQNPILGEYGGQFRLGTNGDLPHNFLAAWLMLGLPGFMIFLVLFVGSCKFVFSEVKKNKLDTPNARFAFSICALSVPLILVAKSSFVEWLPMLFGCAIALSKKRENETRIKSST